MQTYEIVNGPPQAIHCLLCHSVFTEPMDVVRRYCSRCERWHIHAVDDARLSLERAILLARPDLAPAARFELIERFLEVLDPRGGVR